jgi:hypothetical protein
MAEVEFQQLVMRIAFRAKAPNSMQGKATFGRKSPELTPLDAHWPIAQRAVFHQRFDRLTSITSAGGPVLVKRYGQLSRELDWATGRISQVGLAGKSAPR